MRSVFGVQPVRGPFGPPQVSRRNTSGLAAAVLPPGTISLDWEANTINRPSPLIEEFGLMPFPGACKPFTEITDVFGVQAVITPMRMSCKKICFGIDEAVGTRLLEAEVNETNRPSSLIEELSECKFPAATVLSAEASLVLGYLCEGIGINSGIKLSDADFAAILLGNLAGAEGFEPSPSSLTVRCPTSWTTPQRCERLRRRTEAG